MASSTPSVFDNLDIVLAAPDSPVLRPSIAPSTCGKRSATDAELESSELEDEDLNTTSSPSASGGTNKNLILVARKVSTQKKLRNDQALEMEDFIASTLTVQNTLLYGEVLAMRNKLNNILNNPPPFQVSDDLVKNIASYSGGVFFSSKLSAYKGAVPLNHVLDILKCFRFDLPQDIEHNRADWQKVIAEMQEALTQLCSSVKKELKTSVNQADPKKHIGIFELTDKILSKTDVKITIPIMSRTAVMRAVFLEQPGDNAFKHFLVKDREAHGSDAQGSAEPERLSEDVVDTLQRDIDESIEATNPFIQAALQDRAVNPSGTPASASGKP
ncbi:hypothetical protein LXA43DRAFT_1099571 [Ganoderma leucocontextum]|nr:hypothetical protein LXA43DRAFT_1099571 [Ganoderma leucocontextum]